MGNQQKTFQGMLKVVSKLTKNRRGNDARKSDAQIIENGIQRDAQIENNMQKCLQTKLQNFDTEKGAQGTRKLRTPPEGDCSMG